MPEIKRDGSPMLNLLSGETKKVATMRKRTIMAVRAIEVAIKAGSLFIVFFFPLSYP